MELSVRVLCRPAVAAGFELAGVKVETADEEEASGAMKRVAADPGVGVVFVEERLHRALPDDLRQQIERQAYPLVVAFPSPSWAGPSAAEEYVLDLLQQAVGYRVRPR